MNTRPNQISFWMLPAIGLVVGGGISAVDNLAYGGEVSPIVIVGMLLIVGAAVGAAWGIRAIVASVLVWIWLPMAHIVKHLFNLHDTLHPNTYASILKLAVLSFVVTSIGFGLGLLLHQFSHKKAE